MLESLEAGLPSQAVQSFTYACWTLAARLAFDWRLPDLKVAPDKYFRPDTASSHHEYQRLIPFTSL